jgi:chromosome segregation ATPase
MTKQEQDQLNEIYEYMKLHFEYVDDKIDSMQNDISSIHNDISSIHNDIGLMQNDISSMQDNIGSMQNDIDYLVGETKKISEDHEATAYNQIDVAKKVENHEHRIAKLELQKA